MMMRLSRTAKLMCASLAGICLVFGVIGFLVIAYVYSFEGFAPYAAGLAAGTLVSMIKVALMDRSLNRLADMGEAGMTDGARAYALAQSVLRNLISLLVIFAAFLYRGVLGPVGTIIGVLSIQLSALVTGFLLRKESAEV